MPEIGDVYDVFVPEPRSEIPLDLVLGSAGAGRVGRRGMLSSSLSKFDSVGRGGVSDTMDSCITGISGYLFRNPSRVRA